MPSLVNEEERGRRKPEGAEESCQEVVEGCWGHSEQCLPTRGIKGTADLIKLTVAQV